MRGLVRMAVVCIAALLVSLPDAALGTKVTFTCPATPDAGDFPATPSITNPFFPLQPGTVFVYAGTSDHQPASDTFNVTHDTQRIIGVRTIVVRDEGFVAGALVERTFDYFAQDVHGTVWYFGEDTEEFDNGTVVSTEGSWRAGRDGAIPGIIMEAQPAVGDAYCQEELPGVAQDRAQVLSVTDSVCVPFVCADGDALLTKETTPLEPHTADHKWYVSGVGFVRGEALRGGKEVLELVDVVHT